MQAVKSLVNIVGVGSTEGLAQSESVVFLKIARHRLPVKAF